MTALRFIHGTFVKSVLHKAQKAAAEQRVYIPSVQVHDWTEHDHRSTVVVPVQEEDLGIKKKKRTEVDQPSPAPTPS